MRVLQAPSNIANQAWAMAQGLRAHGHQVQVWQYGGAGYGFPADRLVEHGDGPSSYLRILYEAVAEEFDVVHFHFARSLVPAASRLPWFWDLPVWRALGVKVVFTFHGSDVRLRSHHLEADPWSFYRYADVPCDEDRIAAQLAVIRTYADRLTVGSVLHKAYVPEAVLLAKAVEASRLPAVGPVHRRRPVVVHAPSLRSTKGTELILAGFDRLREAGVDFEVDLVEDVSHEELLARVARADVVVEKLLGDDIGVGSLEAMAMGKVAVSRIRPEARAAAPALPSVDADPETFVEVMAALLVAPDRRSELGEAGRAYVLAHHDAPVVGRHLEELYADITPRGLPHIAPGWTAPNVHARLEKAQEAVRSLTAQNTVLRSAVRSAALRDRLVDAGRAVASVRRRLHR